LKKIITFNLNGVHLHVQKEINNIYVKIVHLQKWDLNKTGHNASST
jgi:hypothetical protein